MGGSLLVEVRPLLCRPNTKSQPGRGFLNGNDDDKNVSMIFSDVEHTKTIDDVLVEKN